jgi:hypothetical protein
MVSAMSWARSTALASAIAVLVGIVGSPDATAPAGYSPAELAAAYSLPADSHSGATIAIVGAGVDGNLAADLAGHGEGTS